MRGDFDDDDNDNDDLLSTKIYNDDHDDDLLSTNIHEWYTNILLPRNTQKTRKELKSEM